MIRTIIFDWKRTLYDPDNGELIDGAKELLNALQKKTIPMVLVGKGGEDMYREVKRLEVEKYFTQIVFKEGTKEGDLFKPHLTEDPAQTLFIGDRIRSELAVGKSLGATTIWVRQGKFADELPEHDGQKPDYTTESLQATAEFLSKKI